MVKAELEPKGLRSQERIATTVLGGLGLAVSSIAIVALSHAGHASHPAAKQRATTAAPASAHQPVPDPALSPPATLSSPSAPSSAASAPPSSTAPAPGPPRPSTVAPAPAAAKPAPRQPIVVLNDTQVHGLAKAAQQRLQRGGWSVSAIGNVHNITATSAYYDPANRNARAAAQALAAQFPSIKRVAPRFPGLPAGPIVLVLAGALS